VSQLTDFDLDQDGKIDLHTVYDRPDPRGYYQTLSQFDYRIPSAAEPLFRRTIRALRRARQKPAATLLDVGSSYGVNAAILKHRYSLPALFDIYGRDATEGIAHTGLLERDRALFGNGRADDSLLTIGLDTSAKAIAYASKAGIIDKGIVANFEERAPTPEEAADLASVDLVLSTGAIGYVDAPTFDHILDAARRRPWFAVFALRMFPVARIASALRRRGYAVFKLHGETFRQRRFANQEERAEVFARLDALGVDAAGRENDGWLHAEFFLARPEGEPSGLSLANLRQI
jgi:SAM-dependent methyltransferase